MNLNQIKKDITHIYDLNPDWIDSLGFNPLLDIINKGKSYHLIKMLISVFGVLKANPVIKNINTKHYKQQEIVSIIEEIKNARKDMEEKKSEDFAHYVEILSLVSKIDYFCIYYQSITDGFIKDILKKGYLTSCNDLRYQSKLIFYLIKLGYKNIYIEKALKRIQLSQNSDGGWSLKLPGKESDIFTTLLVHRCFLENDLWKNKDFLKKSEIFLIKNHMSTSNSSEELDRWDRIYTGYRKNNLFEGGSLLLLESLLISQRKAKHMKAISKWLKGLQLTDGFFPYHAKLKNQANLSCTVNVLTLFKKYHLINLN